MTLLGIIYLAGYVLSLVPIAIPVLRWASFKGSIKRLEGEEWIMGLFMTFLVALFWPLVAGGTICYLFGRWLVEHPNKLVQKTIRLCLGKHGQRAIDRGEFWRQQEQTHREDMAAFTTRHEELLIALRTLDQREADLTAREQELGVYERKAQARAKAIQEGWQQPHQDDNTDDLSTVLTRPRTHR